MHTARSILIFFSFACLCSLALLESAAAQDSQDNQPHINPRKSQPTPTPKPKATPQPDEPSQPPQAEPASPQQGESSSRDSQADFNAAPHANEPPPIANKDEGTFLPYNPHKAAKDVEVGNYYLRQKNYRAALERFNDALLNKPDDADATFGLAVTEEKLDLLSQVTRITAPI